MPILLIFLLLSFLNPTSIQAQASGVEVTNVFDLADKEAVDGDILTVSEEGIVRAKIPYDNRLFGIVQSKPLILYKHIDETGTPVIRSGVALVNVTNATGPIEAGDFITSSDKPGKGQKATQSGYIIGVALQPLEGAEGKVEIAIRIEFIELTTARSANRLYEAIGSSLFRSAQDPEKFGQLIRYIAAALIVLLSFSFGFFAFARAVPKAIEAIGRNPLARAAIQFTIVLNIVLTVATGIMGIVGALIILRL